ncbi:Dihydrolipoyl dehydrogenase [Providencia rettgeri]|nr:Dihydrolipoyl dehydrogenase [Providencia rettgeri]
MRKVKIVQGYGKFTSDKELAVEAADGKVTKIAFYNCIIAAGSSVI